METKMISLINAKQKNLNGFMAKAVSVMGLGIGMIVGSILIAGVDLIQIYVYSTIVIIPLPISIILWYIWLKTTKCSVELTETGIKTTFKNSKMWKDIKAGKSYKDVTVGYTDMDDHAKGMFALAFNYDQILYARYFSKKEKTGFGKETVVEIYYRDDNGQGKKFLLYITRKELERLKATLDINTTDDYIGENYTEEDFWEMFGFERDMIEEISI